jgi:pantoate--beta-alanine ligase
MRTVQTVSELRRALAPLREQGKRIGFIPTMGALHEGHMSLVEMSKKQVDVTVVSVFVNPTQFGPNEDFARYPRTVEEDARLLVEADVDFLFVPKPDEIYPEGHSTVVTVAGLTDRYEGAVRPGHFNGVTTVVAALFNIVAPDVAYFGQKDAQQVAVIKRMVRDLHFPIEIKVGATVREAGALALSSRNRFLSESDRARSMSLSSALFSTRDSIADGHSIEEAKRAGLFAFQLAAPEAILDYFDIVDAETFQPITSLDAVRGNGTAATIIIAARIGDTRLIDNLPVELG